MTNEFPSRFSVPDNPIIFSRDDILGWSPIAADFARKVLEIDATQGLVIGLFGTWGSGKTSFINLARPEFEQAGSSVIDFNPWQFSGDDQLLTRFFSELSSAMENKSNLKELGSYLKSYGGVLSPAILGISTLAGSPHTGVILSVLLKLASRKIPPSATASHTRLREALKRHGKPIIVVVDDVDRLSSDEIRELFKLVRITASFPNLVYIIACDRIRVEKALDDSSTGTRGSYIEKIFQWSISVPTASRERVRRELHVGIENVLGPLALPRSEPDWPDIEAEIVQPLVRNMRDVRRYLMAVRGAVDDLGASIAFADILALECIRLFLPNLFDRLPHLVEHLTVPPTWEGNAEHVEDLIFEQTGDAQTAAESRRSELEKVLEAVDEQDRRVARALIRRVFFGGQTQHDDNDSQWPIQQLKSNRVVHRIIFRLYLSRVEDGDLASFNCARSAFERMHDSEALDKIMQSQEPDAWPKTAVLVWNMFRNEFESRHAEPGLIVFWNLLSHMPGRIPFVLDEPMVVVQMVSKALLETLFAVGDSTDAINSVFQQLQSLTSKRMFLAQIRGLIEDTDSLTSDAELRKLERILNNQILWANSDDLIIERHPALVLLFSAQRADPPRLPLIVHDSPKLTFTLMWDCLTVEKIGEYGSRTIETEHGIRWDDLIAIHGDADVLKERIDRLDRDFPAIESWIVSELRVQFSDAQDLLRQAKEYVSTVR